MCLPCLKCRKPGEYVNYWNVQSSSTRLLGPTEVKEEDDRNILDSSAMVRVGLVSLRSVRGFIGLVVVEADLSKKDTGSIISILQKEQGQTAENALNAI